MIFAVVVAALFALAPLIPTGSAEAGFIFGSLLVLVSIATLRFWIHAADLATRE